MRVIVVGLGIQGTKRKRIAGAEVIASIDPVKPEADYSSLQDVALNEYDAALVCTPDAEKLGLLEWLLTNKKHVLVEKPLIAADDQQLLSLQQLARRNGVVCYSAYNHRFEPHLVRMRELLQSGRLGKIYSCSIYYGNGTAREVRTSAWRDVGAGILPDLGSHLLDLLLFFFGEQRDDLRAVELASFENQAPDHMLLMGQAASPLLQLEASMLSWRNTFRLDLIGEKGSAHVDCLCKWGPSTYTLRTRVLPSGRPPEESITLECADPTWQLEYDYFKELCSKAAAGTVLDTVEKDIWINRRLREIWQNCIKSGTAAPQLKR
jgi:scyllo-inositol 2-dehydrogenase (NADP+)